MCVWARFSEIVVKVCILMSRKIQKNWVQHGHYHKKSGSESQNAGFEPQPILRWIQGCIHLKMSPGQEGGFGDFFSSQWCVLVRL